MVKINDNKSIHLQRYEKRQEILDSYAEALSNLGISWAHGTNSNTLMVMRQANIQHLVPTGILRKKYSIYPLAGARDNGSIHMFSGSRRLGVNYGYLSGMQGDKEGLKCVIQYAAKKNPVDLAELHLRIDNYIKLFSITDYSQNFFSSRVAQVRCMLKYCLYAIEHLRILDPQSDHANVIAKLQSALEAIQSLTEKDQEKQIHALITKYVGKMITSLQSDKVSLKLNDEDRALLAQPFPVIFATRKDVGKFIHQVSSEFANKDEKLVEGELAMTNIDFIITDSSNEGYCKQWLVDMNLTHIQVIGIDFKNIILNDQAEEAVIVNKSDDDDAVIENNTQTEDQDQVVATSYSSSFKNK